MLQSVDGELIINIVLTVSEQLLYNITSRVNTHPSLQSLDFFLIFKIERFSRLRRSCQCAPCCLVGVDPVEGIQKLMCYKYSGGMRDRTQIHSVCVVFLNTERLNVDKVTRYKCNSDNREMLYEQINPTNSRIIQQDPT